MSNRTVAGRRRPSGVRSARDWRGRCPQDREVKSIMPRTEGGPAISKAAEWDSGRIEHFFNNPVPLGRMFGYRSPGPNERDDKAKNFLYAPWPTKEDKAARKRDGRIPPYDKPPFDRRGRLPEHAWPELTELTNAMASRGSYCHATWEHAKIGNVSAAVTAKVGETKTYEELVRASEEAKVKRIAARKTYGYRGWLTVRKTYGDIRFGRVIDITYIQAANRDVHAAIFYEYRGPERTRGLRELSPFIDIVAACFLRRRIFRLFDERKGRQADFPFLLSYDNEWNPHNLISEDAKARSEHIKTQAPPKQRVEFPQAAEVIELAKRAKVGDYTAAQRIIVLHQPLVRSIAEDYVDRGLTFSAQALQREELISHANTGDRNEAGELVNGIWYALKKFNPKIDRSFGAFARGPILWAIDSYLRQQRKHSVESLSLNANVSFDDTEDDATTKRRKSISSLNYFNQAIAEAHAERIAPPTVISPRTNNGKRKPLSPREWLDQHLQQQASDQGTGGSVPEDIAGFLQDRTRH